MTTAGAEPQRGAQVSAIISVSFAKVFRLTRSLSKRSGSVTGYFFFGGAVTTGAFGTTGAAAGVGVGSAVGSTTGAGVCSVAGAGVGSGCAGAAMTTGVSGTSGTEIVVLTSAVCSATASASAVSTGDSVRSVASCCGTGPLRNAAISASVGTRAYRARSSPLTTSLGSSTIVSYVFHSTRTASELKLGRYWNQQMVSLQAERVSITTAKLPSGVSV